MKKKYRKEELERLAFHNELQILFDFFSQNWLVVLQLIRICSLIRMRKQVKWKKKKKLMLKRQSNQLKCLKESET